MNIRRINANERFRGLLKLLIFLLLLFLYIFPLNPYCNQTLNLFEKKINLNNNYTMNSLANYSCFNIYNNTINGELIYRDGSNSTYFNDNQVIVYYMTNCLNNLSSIQLKGGK